MKNQLEFQDKKDKIDWIALFIFIHLSKYIYTE